MAKRLPGPHPVIPGFQYLRPLGAGGFSDVFLYQQDMPYREVAVKVLLEEDVDEQTLQMFTTEADVMAQLSSHPNILTIHQASISADGRPYLVMEVCVDSYGRRYRQETIAVNEVLDVGVRIGSALATSHAQGMLHRDVKPSNILISSYGQPVLSDFGVAAAISAMEESEGVAMSLPWSAPEIANATTSGSVAADIWGLGATLYGLLAGRSPFEDIDATRNQADQIRSRIERAQYRHISRPDVPDTLQNVLRKALAKNPQDRYHSVDEMVSDLQSIQNQLGMSISIAPQVSQMGQSRPRAEGFHPSVSRSTVNVESTRVRRSAAEERSRLVQRNRASNRKWFVPLIIAATAVMTTVVVLAIVLLTGGM